MTSLLLATTFFFAPADAEIAYNTASELVEKHTPRDSGTLGSRRAADFICDKLNLSGVKSKQDFFKADTPLAMALLPTPLPPTIRTLALFFLQRSM